MRQICTHCTQEFIFSEKEKELLEKLFPTIGEKKFTLPIPDLCTQCRRQLRLSHRNERKLYRRSCDLTRKPIVSLYSPDKPYKVYDREEWWKDSWDPLSYGRDFDFSKGFFEQFEALKLEVPRPAMVGLSNENSEYVAHVGYSKDCYLIFGGINNERCLYSSQILFSKDCVDCHILHGCEGCYECVDIMNCYHSSYLEHCSGTSFSLFCFDCKNSAYCIGSTGLRDKQYHIFNQPVSKEQFEIYKNQILNDKHALEECKKKFEELVLKLPRKYYFGNQNENFSGDYIYRSKDAFDTYGSTDIEDSIHVTNATKAAFCFDMDDAVENEYCVGGMGIGWLWGSYFTNKCYHSKQLFYSEICSNSEALFGCIGLRNKKYCILNKQYTKEEYELLVLKIIDHMMRTGEWGRFLPASLSHFTYNESIASDFFPLTKEEALSQRWKWKEDALPIERDVSYLPLTTKEYMDPIKAKELLQAELLCKISNKPYRIIPQELSFYIKGNLPLPKKCFEERYKARLAKINPRELWLRECVCCKKSIETSYAPEKPEMIYCEECYIKTVS